jgi:hypothetical protein
LSRDVIDESVDVDFVEEAVDVAFSETMVSYATVIVGRSV